MKTKQLTINRTSWMEFRDCLQSRTPFETYGNLSGHPVSTGYPSLGRLPEPFRSQLDGLARLGQVDYVVYSYSTPIAWHVKDRNSTGTWVMPPVKYSSTTSKAQGRIAPGLASLSPQVTED